MWIKRLDGTLLNLRNVEIIEAIDDTIFIDGGVIYSGNKQDCDHIMVVITNSLANNNPLVEIGVVLANKTTEEA